MICGKRWVISLLVLTLLVVSGTAAWLYYGQLPKKAPLRAHPVFAEQLYRPAIAGEHNNPKSAHTMTVPQHKRGGI